MSISQYNNPFIEEIFRLNDTYVERHRADVKLRSDWFCKNPLHFIIIGCMDGRASHLPQTLGIPNGCFDMFQTAGAKFSLSQPYFSNLLTESILSGQTRGRTTIILVASHFSSKYRDHGCRAFNNDRGVALNHVIKLSNKISHVFSDYIDTHPNTVHVIPIEFNTDDDSIVFHGVGTIDTSQFISSQKGLREKCAHTFPYIANMIIFETLISLIQKNIEYTRTAADQRVERDCHHNEFLLAVGRGFGTWLNPNRNSGIILFGEGEDLDNNIIIAGEILLDNMEDNKIMRRYGALIITCSAYCIPWKKNIAIERASGYSRKVKSVLQKNLPGLSFTLLEGTVDLTTWKFTDRR